MSAIGDFESEKERVQMRVQMRAGAKERLMGRGCGGRRLWRGMASHSLSLQYSEQRNRALKA